jgi:hypothetical protein
MQKDGRHRHKCFASLALLLLSLWVLAACAAGSDRTDDSDRQRPVFYGGVSGSPVSR